MGKHYTIDKKYEGRAGLAIEGNEPVYVPGHSLGEGWTRHIVELAKGDTADNPASTKGPLYGPGFVTYDISPQGTTAYEEDSCKGFYEAIFRGRVQREFDLLKRIRAALEGDSNDAEHDALVDVADFLGVSYEIPERG